MKKLSRKYFLILVFIVLLSIHIQAQNGWTKKADLPTPRAGASACVYGDKIYVIGGDNGHTDLSVNEVYFPLTDNWETKQPMPTSRAYLLTGVVNDTIYAIGGGYGGLGTDKNEAYDPVTDSWATKANLPYLWFGVYGDTIDGNVFIMGGHFFRQDCFVYDPVIDQWTEKAPIPPDGCKGTLSATAYNGLIYTFGGVANYPNGPMSSVNMYNPKTDTWESRTSMPTPRFALRTLLVNDKIYAIGGSQGSGNSLSTLEVYDPVNDTWEILPDMPFKVSWFTGAVFNNKIYVFGGTPDWVTGGDEVWEYDPSYVVPVELTSFTALVNDKEVTLSWSTATELNNLGFEIQRKFTSNNFATVGSIKGQGTTTNPNQYSYIDKLIEGGKYYYRLKQVDFDGTYEYSSVVEVEVRMVDKFTLEQNYPNPFNPSTTVKYSLPKQANVTVKIFDMLGREIETLVNEEKFAGTYEVTWNVINLPTGVYFYQIKTDGHVETKKMILLK